MSSMCEHGAMHFEKCEECEKQVNDAVNKLNNRTVEKWIENGKEVGIIIKERMTKEEAKRRYGFNHET